LLLAIGVGLGDPVQRRFVGLVVAPLGLIWAAAFSYDLRNLALILPFAGAAAGTGLWRVAEWLDSMFLQSNWTVGLRGARPHPTPLQTHPDRGPRAPETLPAADRRSWLRVGHLAGLSALTIVAASLCVSDKSLRECQDRQQRLVGIPELNHQLYAFFESHSGPAVIATDYYAVDWLPELAARSIRCTCKASNAFRATYDRPEVRFALVREKSAATEVQEYLDGPAGRLVFDVCGYRFYEKP
jgi:hypothetical protein